MFTSMLSCIVLTVGPDHILAERHFVILLSTLAFTMPLSLYRNIEKLGKVSSVITSLSLSFSVFKAACKTCLCVCVCYQVSLLSMVLTVAILITVIIRAATFGPQMYELIISNLLLHRDLNGNVSVCFFSPLM